MSVLVRCPRCGKSGAAPDMDFASRARCRRCLVTLDIVGMIEPAPAPEPDPDPDSAGFPIAALDAPPGWRRAPPRPAEAAPGRWITPRRAAILGAALVVIPATILLVVLGFGPADPALSRLPSGSHAVLYDGHFDRVACSRTGPDGELLMVSPPVGFRMIVVDDEADSAWSNTRHVRVRVPGEMSVYWVERFHLRPAKD